METKPESTQDDRLLAALCHIAVLLPMWGLILSGLIWATQREKSTYVRRQGVQALAWQVTLMVVFFLGMGCYMLSIFGIIGGTIVANTSEPPTFIFLPFGVFGLIFLMMFLFVIFGIWATIRSAQGRDFVYPLVGGWALRYFAADDGSASTTAVPPHTEI